MLSPSETWNFGDLVEGQPKEFFASVSSASLDKFEVVSVAATKPGLTLEVTPLTPEQLGKLSVKSGYQIKAVLQPTIDIGEFTDTVTVNVLEPKPIAIKVDVTARRSGPIKIFGPSWNDQMMALGLGSFEPKEGKSVSLNLSTSGVDGELKVVNVKCKDPRISVEIKPDARFKDQVGHVRRYHLIVSVKSSDHAMVHTHQDPLLVEIDTNQPLVKSISLKVRSQALPSKSGPQP